MAEEENEYKGGREETEGEEWESGREGGREKGLRVGNPQTDDPTLFFFFMWWEVTQVEGERRRGGRWRNKVVEVERRSALREEW